MSGVVLFVEDDADDVELSLAAFEAGRFKHRVEFVRDAEKALARLEKAGSPRPALLVVDLNLPRISGLELLERIRANPKLAALPVVVLSSSDDEREKARAAALGALAFLRKPLAFDDFKRVIAELEDVLGRLRRSKT